MGSGCFLLALLDMKGVILLLKYQFKLVSGGLTLLCMIGLCVKISLLI